MKKYCFSVFLLLSIASFSQKKWVLTSPNSLLKVEVNAADSLTYSLSLNNTVLLNNAAIQLQLNDGEVWGKNLKIKKTETKNVAENIATALYKKAVVQNNYNELTVTFVNNYAVVFRLYNDGIAYRFINNKKAPFTVLAEMVQLNFPKDVEATVPYVNADVHPNKNFTNQFNNSFENTYETVNLSKLNQDRLMYLPLLIHSTNNIKLCITEADLQDYPGLYLNAQGNTSLNGVFAPYPKVEQQGGHNNIQSLVKETESFIAKINAPKALPWRVVIVAQNDAELLNNDMSYRLAAPSKIEHTNFIKPGKVAWDWWNDWNISGVDFKAGINTKTYEYYIDFASKYNIEYVILDEGWSQTQKADLLQVNPDIDLPYLVQYAKQKNVGLILWGGMQAFKQDMENVCKHYAAMGIKGFKIDFIDRDDQVAVKFVSDAAETAAKYNLMLDFHGMFKPAGIQRTYPNIVNFEGVYGMEQQKWDQTSDFVTNDLIVPFARMVAGPLDYTPGGMRNAAKGMFAKIYRNSVVQGTRSRQLALYVIYEAPLQMLSDNPTAYLKEPVCTQFIATIPTVWDETIALNGSLKNYATIARRKGNDWFVGGLTNWDKREMEIDLSFLDKEATYQLTLIKDGINADKDATDFVQEVKTVNSSSKIKVTLMSGGGFAMQLKKR